MYIQQVKSGHKSGEETPNQHIITAEKVNKKVRIDFSKEKMMEKECRCLRGVRLLPPKSKEFHAAETYVMSID